MAGKKLSLEALLAQAVTDRHSPLYIAMRDNHAVMIRAFESKRPNWSALVAGFKDLGILDGNGNPPTIRGAQNTWARVKKDLGSKPRQEVKPSLRTPIEPAPPALNPVQPSRPASGFDATEGADEPPATPNFGISKLRRD